MGGPASLTLRAGSNPDIPVETLRDEVVDLLEGIEARYSRYRHDSIVSEINRRAGTGEFTELDAETAALFALADQLWQASGCLLYTSPSPRDLSTSRMPSSA